MNWTSRLTQQESLDQLLKSKIPQLNSSTNSQDQKSFSISKKLNPEFSVDLHTNRSRDTCSAPEPELLNTSEQKFIINEALERLRKESNSCRSSSAYKSEKDNDPGEERRAIRETLGRNNMTPSSILLPSSHDYIEQQQRSISASYHDTNRCMHDNGVDINKRIPGRDCTTSMNSASEGRSCNSQVSCVDPALPPRPSSLMSNSVNQFKGLDGVCNTSIEAAGGCSSSAIATSSPNVVECSNEYQNDQNLSQSIHNQLIETGSISSLHHGYHNGHSEELKGHAGGNQFMNYSGHHFRLSDNSSYNSTSSTMLEHHNHMKPDSSGPEVRGSFDETVNTMPMHETIPTNHQANDSLNTARNLMQHSQQMRANIGQYYGSQYNLMQTPSSKSSSSPASTNSTPSPKTANIMNQNTSQYLNPQISSSMSNPPTSQMQVDSLNQHYISNGITAPSGGNHQHMHQVGHHYGYTQQATAGPSQHHLASMTAANEQSYSHHQHHHPQQHHQHQLHAQQSIYQHLAGNAVGSGVNHMYSSRANNTQYQGHHLQVSPTSHQTAHLISNSHQNQLNNAAAACAAAAVVSQTLKTVANQHVQSHHYSNTINNGFDSNSSFMTHHTGQFHNINPLVNHQSNNSGSNHHISVNPHQHSVSSANSVVTRKYQCKMCPQVSCV